MSSHLHNSPRKKKTQGDLKAQTDPARGEIWVQVKNSHQSKHGAVPALSGECLVDFRIWTWAWRLGFREGPGGSSSHLLAERLMEKFSQTPWQNTSQTVVKSGSMATGWGVGTSVPFSTATRQAGGWASQLRPSFRSPHL